MKAASSYQVSAAGVSNLSIISLVNGVFSPIADIPMTNEFRSFVSGLDYKHNGRAITAPTSELARFLQFAKEFQYSSQSFDRSK